MSSRRIVFFIVLTLISGNLMSQGSKPAAPKKYAYLKIFHEHQSPNLCLPTCVAMVLNYYGAAKSQWTIKRLSNEHKELFSGTSFEEIQEGMKPLGYTWDRWRWPADSAGFFNAIDALEQSLDAGKPVIIGITVLDYPTLNLGHALLVFGYDAEEQEVFLLDPAMGFPGKRHLSFHTLREMWNRGGHFQGLFTAPMGELPVGHPRQ